MLQYDKETKTQDGSLAYHGPWTLTLKDLQPLYVGHVKAKNQIQKAIDWSRRSHSPS